MRPNPAVQGTWRIKARQAPDLERQASQLHGTLPMNTPGSPITFLRKRDYVFIRVLGQGACGQTVLLRDEVIGSDFVCKKYVPFDEAHRQELYKGFLREIKLLHEVYHTNVVRVFNYYLYPDQFTGYILMEYVEAQILKSIYAQSQRSPTTSSFKQSKDFPTWRASQYCTETFGH